MVGVSRKLSGIIGIVVALVCLLAGAVIEGTSLTALLSPTAALIVFGGTIGAVIISFPIDNLKRIGKVMKVAFTAKEKDLIELIVYFKELAFKTRKNGLLSIEGEMSGDTNMDPFIKKGLQMIVDGVEPQSVRSIMELEADMTSERHKEGAAMFDSAGGYAPTMGIVGTVLALVNVLGHLSGSDSASLGEKISGAFIATLFGIASANILWLPIGSRLKAIDKQETTEKELIIEAILFIQEGVNPNTIAEKLKGFLNKEQLAKYESIDKKVEA